MKIKFTSCAAAMLALSSGVMAQDAAPLQVQMVQAQPAAAFVLPANTEVKMEMNQDVTTRGDTWSEGDTFELSVSEDVLSNGFIVIPQGTRAVGHIVWMTSRGAFGKSGKMDIELDYLEMGGRRVPINGTFRQEGEGNTLATVGGVIVAGIFAGFITGKSALIPQGRELTAFTENDLPLALPAGVSAPAAAPATLTVAVPAAQAAQAVVLAD